MVVHYCLHGCKQLNAATRHVPSMFCRPKPVQMLQSAVKTIASASPNSSQGQLLLYVPLSVGDRRGDTLVLCPTSMGRQLLCALCMGRGSGSWLLCLENGNCTSGAFTRRVPTAALSQNKGAVSSGITAQISWWLNVGGPEVRAGDLELGSDNSPTTGLGSTERACFQAEIEVALC